MTPAWLTLLVGVIACIVASSMTPLAGRLAGMLEMQDRPSDRKIHRGSVPYLGGLAILAGWCVVFITPGALAAGGVLLVGMMVLMVTGFMDDRREMSPYIRLGVQVVVALIAFGGGVRMSPLDNVTAMEGWMFDLPITVLWLVGMTNAFNFMDNMDGLAAGVGGISAAALGLVGMLLGQQLVSVFAFGLVGACLGFLRHNFHPARIFMGDTGSLPLGFALAVVAAKIEFPGIHPVVAFSIPIVILGLFVIDTAVMLLGRMSRDEPVIGGRLDHLSHRLLQKNIHPRVVALRLYGAAVLLGMIAVAIVVLPFAAGMLLVSLVVAVGSAVVSAAVAWPILVAPPNEKTPVETVEPAPA